MDNTSGQGKGSAIPEEIRGLCWGGFFWNWLWGIFNRVWLSFLVFVPVVGFVVAFVLLFKGREWAWQNRTWESVEHFNKIQRRWTIAGLITLGIVVLGFAAIVLLMFSQGGGSPPPAPVAMKPATPKPPAPKPQPKPAATVAASTPAATPVPAAPAGDKPDTMVATTKADAGKGDMAKGEKLRSEPIPAPVAAQRRAVASDAKAAAPAPRVHARRPARNTAAPAVASAVEAKIVTPKYNDLMTAVLRPDRAGVVELLDLGRWVDKPDSNGATPLLAAVRMHNTGIAEVLLSRGANPNASSSRGMSVLDVARASGDVAMAALLQRHGAR